MGLIRVQGTPHDDVNTGEFYQCEDCGEGYFPRQDSPHFCKVDFANIMRSIATSLEKMTYPPQNVRS